MREGRSKKKARAGAGGGDGGHGDGRGQAIGPGDPAYYWDPDCRRNGTHWRAMMKGSERWSRADKAAVLKTGGVEGIAAVMGAGSLDRTGWEECIDSWVQGLKGRSESSMRDYSVVGLLRACEEAVQAGVASDFYIMVRHVQLFLLVYQ